MSLYTQYRPSNFNGLVGQDTLKTILLHQIKTGQLFHNYLFFGGRGTGKTSTARLLAKAVNCTMMTAEGMPDLDNDSIAKQIEKGQTIDVIEIDAASHTGVDNIREEIIEKSSYPPAQLKKKVYIIDEVHMLSKGAFNALLKIMEEPPSYVMFILATTELHKVPETIVSRCQVFNFKQLTQEQVVGHLQMIADKEKIETTLEGLQMIAKLAGGAMRDAIKYLEQVSMLGAVTPEHVSQFLGVASTHVIATLVQSLITDQINEAFALLSSLAEGGTDMLQLVKDCMTYCNDNFNKNPEEYAELARQLKDLYQNMKWYPSGLLAWKVSFESKVQSVQDIQTTKNDKKYEKKVGGNNNEGNASGPQHDQGIVSSVILTKEESQGIITNDVSNGEGHKDNGQSTTDNGQPNVSVNPLINAEQLLEYLINSCEKTMVKSSLKNYTMIDRIESGVVEAVIINEQFFTLMNKPEITSYLEGLLEQGGFGKLSLKLIYMTKEDYVVKSMMV